MALAGLDTTTANGTDIDVDFPDDDFADDTFEVSTTSPLLEPRQSGTDIFIGRTQTDYGCGGSIASIRSVLGDAAFSLCRNSVCGRGTVYTRKITHMHSGGYKQDRWIQVRAEGRYNGPTTRGAIRDGVRATVRSESVSYATRRRRAGPNGIGDSSTMAKFSNYL